MSLQEDGSDPIEYMDDDHDVILFMESNNGKIVMQYEGYHFFKAYKNKNGEKWICATRKTCPAYVNFNDDNEILTNSLSHNHSQPRPSTEKETDDSGNAPNLDYTHT